MCDPALTAAEDIAELPWIVELRAVASGNALPEAYSFGCDGTVRADPPETGGSQRFQIILCTRLLAQRGTPVSELWIREHLTTHDGEDTGPLVPPPIQLQRTTASPERPRIKVNEDPRSRGTGRNRGGSGRLTGTATLTRRGPKTGASSWDRVAPNDIASAAEEVVVVVKHDPGRLAVELPYITAPGRHVTAITATKAIFERTGGVFVLTGYFAEAHDDPDEIMNDIRECTGWDVVVSDAPQPVAQPTAEELMLLRGFDPRSIFLKNKDMYRKAARTGQHGSLQVRRAIDGW
jgi:hypothetical protein